MRLALCLLLVSLKALAATYYASPTGGGAASCVDNAANVCTLDRAITVSAHGDTIVMSSGTYDYTTTGLNISSKNVTLDSAEPYGAIITSTNATRTLALSPSNNVNELVAGDIWVTGTGTASPLQVNSVAYDATARISGTKVTIGTSRAIQDSQTQGTTIIENCVLTGTMTAATGAITSTATITSAKKLKITGCSGDLLANGNLLGGAMLVNRPTASAVALYAEITNNNFTLTQQNTGSGAGLYGLRIQRVGLGTDFGGVTNQGALIQGNTIVVTSLPENTVVDTYGIVVDSDDATATSVNSRVIGNTLTCYARVARCLAIGIDGVTQAYANDAVVTGNYVYGTYYDGVSTPHGISLGRVTGGQITRNFIQGFAVGALASINNGGLIHSNILRGCNYACLFAKGNTAVSFFNNTVMVDSSVLGANLGSYGAIGVAIQGATNNAAASFINNNIYANTPARTWVTVDSAQVASFNSNNYYGPVPTQSNAWVYQSNTYTTLGTWNGDAVVGTDLSVATLFVGGSAPATPDGFKPYLNSPLCGAGKQDPPIAGTHYDGQRFGPDPSIGAFGCH